LAENLVFVLHFVFANGNYINRTVLSCNSGLTLIQPSRNDELFCLTVAVDQTSPERRGQSMAQYQCFYDLGIGLGSLTLGAFLDLVDQNFSLMYAVAAVVALIGLWIYWKRS